MAEPKLFLLFTLLSFILLQLSLPDDQVLGMSEIGRFLCQNGAFQHHPHVSTYPAFGIQPGKAGSRSHSASGHGSYLSDQPIRDVLQPYRWNMVSAVVSKRRLLQSSSSTPSSPLGVIQNGKVCILLRVKKLAIRYKNHTAVDLTERTFGPDAPVDTKGSMCNKDKATLSLRFGDVEDLKGLVIRLQMSNTFYESAGQNWFTLDSVHIHYNWSHEATFNATDVYAPATYSYHCQHVSSLQKYDTLLVPSSHSDSAANWHITFTDFQIQAFNILSGRFASASDCATFFTPAILMGLVTSLILLLVLAYALHMVVHLKHIDRCEEPKASGYFPRNSDSADCTDKSSQ